MSKTFLEQIFDIIKDNDIKHFCDLIDYLHDNKKDRLLCFLLRKDNAEIIVEYLDEYSLYEDCFE